MLNHSSRRLAVGGTIYYITYRLFNERFSKMPKKKCSREALNALAPASALGHVSIHQEQQNVGN